MYTYGREELKRWILELEVEVRWFLRDAEEGAWSYDEFEGIERGNARERLEWCKEQLRELEGA